MSTKVYNTTTKRLLTINGLRYNELIASGYYMKEGKLYAPTKIQSVEPTLIPKNVLSNTIVEPTLIPKSASLNTVLEPTLNHILQSLSVQDLLALYITDKEIHATLNNTVFLQTLSNKFNVSYNNNFTEFLTNYNLHLIPYHQQYLYKLENNIEMPKIFTPLHITADMREIVIDWLEDVIKSFRFGKLVIGLAVTLLDCFLSKIDVTREEFQLVAVACLYLAVLALLETTAEISDLVYITDGAYDRKQIINKIIEVTTTLNGVIIRPSILFYVDQKDVNLMKIATISYYDTKLITYKPSLIYEAVHYMLYGTYKIYTLDEINQVCILMNAFIDRHKNTVLAFLKGYISDVFPLIKFKCGTKTTPIKINNFVYTNEWHIKPDTPIKMVGKLGKGHYGSVKHMNVCDVDYAVKKSDMHLDPSLLEIMILRNIINHPNIITLCHFDIRYDSKYVSDAKTLLYMPLMTGDLDKLIVAEGLDRTKLPMYFKQLVLGVHYCHEHDIMIRDIKPQNIVYSKEDDQLKLIDFGISVPYASYRKYNMPEMASTLWFRAPEALLGDTHYTTKIDIWALGTVFVFMENKKNFFTGDAEIDQLYKIFQILGTPNENIWPGVTSLPEWKTTLPQWKPQKLTNFILKYTDIIGACLVMDPQKRANTTELLTLLHTNYQV